MQDDADIVNGWGNENRVGCSTLSHIVEGIAKGKRGYWGVRGTRTHADSPYFEVHCACAAKLNWNDVDCRLGLRFGRSIRTMPQKERRTRWTEAGRDLCFVTNGAYPRSIENWDWDKFHHIVQQRAMAEAVSFVGGRGRI